MNLLYRARDATSPGANTPVGRLPSVHSFMTVTRLSTIPPPPVALASRSPTEARGTELKRSELRMRVRRAGLAGVCRLDRISASFEAVAESGSLP